MSFLIRVEDRAGRIKSYFKMQDIHRARYVYKTISEQCLQRGEVVKLLNENFAVLESNIELLSKQTNNSK